MLKLLLFTAAVLQFAAAVELPPASEVDWRKTRPANLLAEVGANLRDTADEDFELVKEPIIIRFDRDWSSSDPLNRERCPIFTGEGGITAKNQVCLCYYSEGVHEADDYLKCGENYGAICSSTQYADVDVFPFAGKYINFRTGRLGNLTKFTIQEKLGDDGNIVPMIRLKKIQDGCGLIYVENVYKQDRLHEMQEVQDYIDSLECPPCKVDNCDAEIDDGTHLYPPSKEEATPEATTAEE